MTPVDQEFISDPSIGQFGDCERVVMASLLDLPIAEVPHFLQEAGGDSGKFWSAVRKFCAKHGYRHVVMKSDCFSWTSGATYHGISGPSPRGNGLFHAVVGCNGRIVHDPHASRAGLAGDPKDWEFTFLVRL